MIAKINDQIKNRVSIIIPIYNYAQFLSDAINSILSSCHFLEFDIEILVIDDGSTDNTKDVAASFGEKIKYTWQENQGLSAARNKGISLSTGQYIFFLDSDDMISPTYIKEQYDLIKKSKNNTIVVCQNYFFQKKQINSKPKPKLRWLLYDNNLRLHLYYRNIAPPHCFFMERSIIDKIGFFDKTLKACEDYDFWFRALKHGYRFVFNGKTSVFYRQHSSSMSKQKKNQLYYDKVLFDRIVLTLSNNKRLLYGGLEFLVLAVHSLRLYYLSIQDLRDSDNRFLEYTSDLLNFFDQKIDLYMLKKFTPELIVYLSKLLLFFNRCQYSSKRRNILLMELDTVITKIFMKVSGSNHRIPTVYFLWGKSSLFSSTYTKILHYEIFKSNMMLLRDIFSYRMNSWHLREK